jgi:hypothetical protein
MGDWRKSTYSGANGGQCVEVSAADTVLVRDTTNRAGFTLSVPATAWQTFLNELRLVQLITTHGSPVTSTGLSACQETSVRAILSGKPRYRG